MKFICNSISNSICHLGKVLLYDTDCLKEEGMKVFEFQMLFLPDENFIDICFVLDQTDGNDELFWCIPIEH